MNVGNIVEVMFCNGCRFKNAYNSCYLKGMSLLFLRLLHEREGNQNYVFECVNW